MAAHALVIAARLARYDSAAVTPPIVLAAWLRTPPNVRWAALEVLSDAGAVATLDRLAALAAHVARTALEAEWAEEWSGPGYGPSGAPFTEAVAHAVA